MTITTNPTAQTKRRLRSKVGRCVFAIAVVAFIVSAGGCTHFNQRRQVDLGEIYNKKQAQLPDYQRNPVIVIPGILGSRLVDDESGDIVWGELGPNASNPVRARSLNE